MRKTLLLSVSMFFATLGYSQFSAGFIQNPYCYGACVGYAYTTPTGNYHYLWDDGSTYSADSNMCAGAHFCVVYDSVGNSLDTVRVTK